MDLDKLIDSAGRLLLLGEPPIPFARDEGNRKWEAVSQVPLRMLAFYPLEILLYSRLNTFLDIWTAFELGGLVSFGPYTSTL